VYIYEFSCEFTIEDIMPYCFYLKKKIEGKREKEKKEQNQIKKKERKK